MYINNRLRELIHSGALSGIILIITFIIALIISNNGFLRQYYIALVYIKISVSAGNFGMTTTFIDLVNDGLMTFFFLLIGLEMKFHLVEGEYKEKKNLILPSVAALGGVVVPALIYGYFNFNEPTLKGWAIPIATDTAFVLGIVSFFRKYTSLELRAFIIGFSLIDDAFALVILALFYTKIIYMPAVLFCGIIIIILSLLNYLKVYRTFYYLLAGLLLWIGMVESGMHGTLCGAIIALFIPVKHRNEPNISFKDLEELLHPLVNYCILPLFVFMNSGIVLKNFTFDSICSHVTIGIIFGLFIGKQVGIMLFSYPAIRLNFCPLPYNTSWLKFYSIAILGGIGFTLSLFIGSLTFESGCPSNSMRVSVIIGSLLSAIMGSITLYYSTKNESR